MRKLTRGQQLVTQLLLGLVAIFVLIPIWGLALVAFDGSLHGAPVQFRLWPEEFSIAVFVKVWQNSSQSLGYWGLLQNSLLISGGAAITAVGFGLTAAYAFARFRFSGERVGLFGLLLGTLLPPVALTTPLYILLSQLGIRDSSFGLMLVYTAFAMPFCVWNMRATFQAVPLDLEEAAFLDGASVWQAFWHITLPLALPAIAVAALIAFLLGYTEFALGWMFVETGSQVTLAMAIRGLMSYGLASWPQVAALAILMSLPVVVIFVILRRYLWRGVLMGVAE